MEKQEILYGGDFDAADRADFEKNDKKVIEKQKKVRYTIRAREKALREPEGGVRQAFPGSFLFD